MQINHTARQLALALAASLLGATALAKLPAPDPAPAAQAKRAEAAAKAAWANKVADYQLCKSQDRVATAYQGDLKKRGAQSPDASANAVVNVPACADPGPFAMPEAPAATAAAPAPAPAPANAAAAPQKK